MPAFNPRDLQGRANYLSQGPDLPPPGVEMQSIYRHRLAMLREAMAAAEMDACVLFDAVNIRHACGARNMQIFTSRNPASRYLFVPREGKLVLFEFPGCAHLAEDSIADEIRPAVAASAVAADIRQDEKIKQWADEIADLAGRCGNRLGMEAATVGHWRAMTERGFVVSDAQRAVERARARKSAEEIECIRHSIAAADIGAAKMREAIRPGISEAELWSALWREILAADGDYVETRLLASGPRSNPWFQECSARKILGDGELVALDTDVVGPCGYYADYSRTFLCGDRPTARQRTLYKTALEQIEFNLALLKPGMAFREIAEKAWPLPEEFAARRYFVLAHGVGMTGEYPYILHRHDFDDSGYDGVLQPMTTLCLESYIGGEGDSEGVKLEQQVLITETGCELLSNFPIEESLAGREF